MLRRSLCIEYTTLNDSWVALEEEILDVVIRHIEKEGGQVDGANSYPTSEEEARDNQLWEQGYNQGLKDGKEV